MTIYFRSLTTITLSLFALSATPVRAGESEKEEEQVVPITEVFEPNAADFDPKKFDKVAVLQWAGPPVQVEVTKEHADNFKASVRRTMERYIREAAGKGAKMIITPEFGTVGYPDLPGVPDEDDQFRNRKDLEPYTELVNGVSSQFFGALAKELGVYIQVGIAEVDAITKLYYNTVIVMTPKGDMAASYRKINLFGPEKDFLTPGTTPTTYESPYGRVGLAVCADIYSSNPMSAYKNLGVKIIGFSTSWDQMNTGMDNFKNAARRGGFYVLAANQVYFPDSGVVDPTGKAQSHIRQSTGLAYGYIPRVTPAVPR